MAAHLTPGFQRLPTATSPADLYQSSTGWRLCYNPATQSQSAVEAKGEPARTDCSTAYAAYSSPPGLVAGNDVAYLAYKTTGVTDRGGVVGAIVRTGTLKKVDEIGYADPNVPCGTRPRAKWTFFKVALGGTDYYGWWPLRLPDAPAAGLPAAPAPAQWPRRKLPDSNSAPCVPVPPNDGPPPPPPDEDPGGEGGGTGGGVG